MNSKATNTAQVGTLWLFWTDLLISKTKIPVTGKEARWDSETLAQISEVA
jgi:hypothetical protein